MPVQTLVVAHPFAFAATLAACAGCPVLLLCPTPCRCCCCRRQVGFNQSLVRLLDVAMDCVRDQVGREVEAEGGAAFDASPYTIAAMVVYLVTVVRVLYRACSCVMSPLAHPRPCHARNLAHTPVPQDGVVAAFLPRNTDLSQLAAVVPEAAVWEVERAYVNNKLKGITLYCHPGRGKRGSGGEPNVRAKAEVEHAAAVEALHAAGAVEAAAAAAEAVGGASALEPGSGSGRESSSGRRRGGGGGGGRGKGAGGGAGDAGAATSVLLGGELNDAVMLQELERALAGL